MFWTTRKSKEFCQQELLKFQDIRIFPWGVQPQPIPLYTTGDSMTRGTWEKIKEATVIRVPMKGYCLEMLTQFLPPLALSDPEHFHHDIFRTFIKNSINKGGRQLFLWLLKMAKILNCPL